MTLVACKVALGSLLELAPSRCCDPLVGSARHGYRADAPGLGATSARQRRHRPRMVGARAGPGHEGGLQDLQQRNAEPP